MVSRKKIWLLLFACLIIGNAISQTNWRPYQADISFKIKNAGFTVDGSFTGFKGILLFDFAKLYSSSLKGSIQVGTINTGIKKRDEHLRGESYFYEARFKTIDISSTEIYKTNRAYEGKFNLTIKGKTIPVIIPFTFTSTGTEAIFEGSFKINRRDFNVGGSSWILGDDVIVTIIVNARK